MPKRKIIEINENKCNGCGLCIPNCPEGAIQIIDGKARLISDLFCDGLGACLGHCPKSAITIVEREAQDYDERKVMNNIIKQGPNVIKAHLLHLKKHNQTEYLSQAIEYLKEKKINVPALESNAREVLSGCPGSRMMDFRGKTIEDSSPVNKSKSQLRQWPVQLMLVSPLAPYLNNADLLIAADCVPFACANFHQELLRGKALLVGCPKLDDMEIYSGKIAQILEHNDLKSITYTHMEVPCCFGLSGIIQEAIEGSGKKIPYKEIVIGINGELQ